MLRAANSARKYMVQVIKLKKLQIQRILTQKTRSMSKLCVHESF